MKIDAMNAINLDTMINNAARNFISLLHDLLQLDSILNFEDYFSMVEALQRRNNVRFKPTLKKIFYKRVSRDQVYYCNDFEQFKELCASCMSFNKIKY